MCLGIPANLFSKKRRINHNSEEPSQQNIIAVGQFAIIHKLNNNVVRKLQSNISDTFYSVEAMKMESSIYNHLGKHKHIARYISACDDFVDLRYEPKGDLESYLKKNDLAYGVRCRLARQAIKAVVFIHEKEIVHSDLAARQFLLDGRCNLRLCDFGGSSLKGADAVVMENATHFLPRDESLPNTVESDLFALGSTIYEILFGQKPYEGIEDDEVQRLYSEKSFPPLDKIKDAIWRDIIRKCWMCEYKFASDILKDLPPIRHHWLIFNNR